ncbi:hypothetical protein RF11_13324 [Thelohanellus kitauei]|uniref:Uncharacterized protein n=1 Tax=Thelohanellus kitauei TaxID=669202 RepID=A0A0C2NK38_THEKT|nr:hypothetical protein RF11_13324 [Thelohanellus kitauei]
MPTIPKENSLEPIYEPSIADRRITRDSKKESLQKVEYFSVIPKRGSYVPQYSQSRASCCSVAPASHPSPIYNIKNYSQRKLVVCHPSSYNNQLSGVNGMKMKPMLYRYSSSIDYDTPYQYYMMTYPQRCCECQPGVQNCCGFQNPRYVNDLMYQYSQDRKLRRLQSFQCMNI